MFSMPTMMKLITIQWRKQNAIFTNRSKIAMIFLTYKLYNPNVYFYTRNLAFKEKKMFKKILCMLVALLLLVSLVACDTGDGDGSKTTAKTTANQVNNNDDGNKGTTAGTTAGQSGGYSEGLLYVSYEDGYKVAGIGTCTDTDISIPKTYKDEDVIAIGAGAFKNCSNIKSVTMTDNIESIGYEAFSGCSSLESITLPWVNDQSTQTSFNLNAASLFGFIFGRAAYQGGVEVTQFYRTRNTEPVTANEVTYYIPANLKTVKVIEDKLWNEGIGEAAFSGCTMIENVTLPASAGISQYMFAGCTSLKSVNIPAETTIIWDHAFYGCTSLASISLPSTLSEIGTGAFKDCTALASISLPSRLEEIGDWAFDGCTSLTGSITLPSSVTYVGNDAFDGTGITTIYTSASTTLRDEWGSGWNGSATVSRS